MSPQKPRNTFHSPIKAQMKTSQLAGGSRESAPASTQCLSRWKHSPDTTEQGEGRASRLCRPQSPLVSLPLEQDGSSSRASGATTEPGCHSPILGHPHSACSVLWGLSCFPWHSWAPPTSKVLALLIPSATPGPWLHLPSCTVPQPMEVTWG